MVFSIQWGAKTRMFIKPLCFLFAMLVSASAWSAAYVYTGPPYTSVGGTYNTGMRISGVFTTAAPLAPNLSNAEIGPHGLGLVTSWSFSDGVTIYANSNSSNYGGVGSDFVVSTDAAGDITAFSIGLQKPIQGLHPIMVDAFRVATSPMLYHATSQSPCLSYIVLLLPICAQFDDPGPNFGSAQNAGSFTTLQLTAIPTLSGGGVLLLLGLMAVSTALYLRRKSG